VRFAFDATERRRENLRVSREKKKKRRRTFADERRRVDGDRSDDASVRRGLRLARRDAEHDAEDTQPRGAVTVTGCRFLFFETR